MSVFFMNCALFLVHVFTAYLFIKWRESGRVFKTLGAQSPSSSPLGSPLVSTVIDGETYCHRTIKQKIGNRFGTKRPNGRMKKKGKEGSKSVYETSV